MKILRSLCCLLFLLSPLLANAQSSRSEELTKRHLKLHAPVNRVIGNTPYNLTPLIQWQFLDPKVRDNTPRPYQFGNWFFVDAGTWTRTNGWAVGVSRKNTYVAVRNLPATNHPLLVLLYKLPSDVTVLYGATLVRAAAYDFGLPGKGVP